MLRKIVLFGWILLISTLTVIAQDTIAIGDEVEGELDTDDTVEYSLEADAGDFLEIQLTSDDFDAVLTIYNQDDEVITSNDDGGEGTNSLVRFNIPESGLYRIVVSAFSSDQSGDFQLSVARFEVVSMSPGEAIEVEFGQEQRFWFSFKALANEVVTISAVSNGEIDTTLTLIGPDGQEVTRNDDGGTGTDPLIFKALLPLDGVYLIYLDPYAGDMIEGRIAVTVETAEVISLDDGQTEEFRFDMERSEEVFSFSAEEGAAHRLTISTSAPIDFQVAVYLNNVFVGGANVANSTQLSFDMIVPEDGVAFVRVYGLYYYERDSIALAITRSEPE